MNWKVSPTVRWLWSLFLIQLFLPGSGFGKIFIDINAPSIQKIKIAIPGFKNLSRSGEGSNLSRAMADVLSNDLDLSGYFTPMDRAAFLENETSSRNAYGVRFKNWTVIGAELLLMGKFTTIGRSVEVEVRLFDVFWGRQILGKRVLGKRDQFRALMHRIGNEIVKILTGHKGMFLSKMAFVGTATGHKEIYISDFDGRGVRQMTFDKSISLLPRWSPFGKKIIFTSYKAGGPMLFIRDLKSNGTRKLSARKGLNIGAGWSYDGKKVALTMSHKGNPDIYTIDLNGKILRKVTNYWGIDVSPTFSPKGDKIAFVSNRSGTPQIYMRDLVKGREERLTFKGNYNTSPHWSIVNRIAFTGAADGHFDIFTLDPENGNLRRLTENQGDNEDPYWSPDGRYIVFSSNREGKYHLYIMNASGQNQRRITFLKGQQTSPSWSPF